MRTTLQTSLKKDVDHCSRLKDELQQLGEAVNGLHDKSKKEMEFIASRKCMDKIQESESYLKSKHVKVQSSITFKAKVNIEQYLSQQVSQYAVSVQSLTLEMKPEQVLTVKRKSKYNVKISEDKSQNCCIRGICSLPSGQVIVADSNNKRVKFLDKHYNVSSHCDLSGCPWDICQITSMEVALTVNNDVQFMSVTNGHLVNGRNLQLPHDAVGIAHHQGALYITSRTALYHYTLTGTLVKKLYEDTGGGITVYTCAVSPAGDKIYVTNNCQHKLITLATDGTLISTFTDRELQHPQCVHVTPAGQVLVCGCASQTLIQVNCEGNKNWPLWLHRKMD
ncbi:uncharacterized protein LOC127875256 [Dreissena polymorpha]|nr:uncharacterized protein LOC127875256 [Dreissena polymorpha]